jgi:hypothetical protein
MALYKALIGRGSREEGTRQNEKNGNGIVMKTFKMMEIFHFVIPRTH